MLFGKVFLAMAVYNFVEVAIAQGGGQFGGQGQQNQGQTSAVQTNQAASTAASATAVATGGASGNGGESLQLNSDALQTGSESDGQGAGVSGVKSGQAPAATSVSPHLPV